MEVCWQSPFRVGIPGVAFYTVSVTDTSGSSEVTFASTGDDVTRLNVTNLMPGVGYAFRVQAVSKAVDVEAASEFSDSRLGTTQVAGEERGCGI